MKVYQSHQFIKSDKTSPQFSGYTRTVLGRAIDEYVKTPTPTVEMTEKLLEKVKKFLAGGKEGKALGAGFRGRVFKIDDKYVLKTDNGAECYELETPKIASVPNLRDLKSYFGAPVLSFNRFCRVLRNVSSDGKHMCAGIPSSKEKNLIFQGQKAQYWNEEYLPRFSELPQKSFDALAKDFYELNLLGKQGQYLAFDTKNPNNIVLVGKNTLRIVDDLDKTYSPNQNTTAGLLNLLVNKMDLDYNAPKDLTNIAQRCTLIKKIILAGEKNNLPLMNTHFDCVILDCVCEEFCNYRDLVRDIREINFQYNADKKMRLEKIEKYLNSTFSPDNATNISRWD